MFHRQNKFPPISLSLDLAIFIPRWNIYYVNYRISVLNIHHLLYRLLGSLILFDTYTFMPQRQINIDYCFRLLNSYGSSSTLPLNR